MWLQDLFITENLLILPVSPSLTPKTKSPLFFRDKAHYQNTAFFLKNQWFQRLSKWLGAKPDDLNLSPGIHMVEELTSRSSPTSRSVP